MPSWIWKDSSPFSRLITADAGRSGPGGLSGGSRGPGAETGRQRGAMKRRREGGAPPAAAAAAAAGGGGPASGNPAAFLPYVHTWRSIPCTDKVLVHATWNGLQFSGVLRTSD